MKLNYISIQTAICFFRIILLLQNNLTFVHTLASSTCKNQHEKEGCINIAKSRRSVISALSSSTTFSTLLMFGQYYTPHNLLPIANGAVDESGEQSLRDQSIQQSIMRPEGLGSAKFNPVIVSDQNSSPEDDWKILTNLGKSRILATELSPLSPSLIPFSNDNELYYDSFLFGSWNVTAKLKRKIYPYGVEYLPSRSLFEGSPRNRMEQPGDETTYQLRFFSTLPNDTSNQVKVNLGLGVPKSKIISDRRFNTISLNQAYKQLTPIEDVLWDPRSDPTRLSLVYNPGLLTDDYRPLGSRRGEVYYTARKSESLDQDVFAASERYRSVMLSSDNVVVSDLESITEYRLVNDDNSDGNHVKAFSRLAVYLTPNPNSREGLLWEKVAGKAVAFFDYEMDMQRNLEEVEKGVFRPCVLTPKDVIQCL